MPKRGPELYISDIRDAIARVEDYTNGFIFETFRDDSKTIDAVIRNFEIMGEAAAHAPEEFKKQHPEIPWAKVIGMRNKVAHEYFGVDAEIIWKTI